MTQAESRRLESIQLMTQAAFQELTQNQLTSQADSPGIDADRLMAWAVFLRIKSNSSITQNANHFFIQINSWLKRKHFILSRLMIRLWVIPMSGYRQVQLPQSSFHRTTATKHYGHPQPSLCWTTATEYCSSTKRHYSGQQLQTVNTAANT